MTEGTLSHALLPYMDYIGLIQDKAGGLSGNGILYTAEAAVRLREVGELDASWRRIFLHAVEKCQMPDELGTPIPGYYRRHPDPRGFSAHQERQDDYIAIAVLAKLLDAPYLAEDVLKFGQRRKQIFPPLPWPSVRYYYPNENGWDAFFDPRAWLGVYPAMIACLKLACGQVPTPLEREFFEAGISHGPNQKDTTDRDSYVLPWLMKQLGGTKDSHRQYDALLERAYPGGVPTLLRAYFLDKNHPLGAEWKRVM